MFRPGGNFRKETMKTLEQIIEDAGQKYADGWVASPEEIAKAVREYVREVAKRMNRTKLIGCCDPLEHEGCGCSAEDYNQALHDLCEKI